jgi:hypothetical protein
MAPWRHGRIYLGGRWHEPSAGPLKLPAGDNSAYPARWAAALAHEQVRCRKTKRGYQNIPSRYPRNDRFAPQAAVPKKSVFDPNHGSNGRCPFVGGKADSAAACTGFILGESLFAQMKTRTVMQQPFA